MVGNDVQLRRHIFGLFHYSSLGVIPASMLLGTRSLGCYTGRAFLKMLSDGFVSVLFASDAKLIILLHQGFCNLYPYQIEPGLPLV